MKSIIVNGNEINFDECAFYVGTYDQLIIKPSKGVEDDGLAKDIETFIPLGIKGQIEHIVYLRTAKKKKIFNAFTKLNFPDKLKE